MGADNLTWVCSRVGMTGTLTVTAPTAKAAAEIAAGQWPHWYSLMVRVKGKALGSVITLIYVCQSPINQSMGRPVAAYVTQDLVKREPDFLRAVVVSAKRDELQSLALDLLRCVEDMQTSTGG